MTKDSGFATLKYEGRIVAFELHRGYTENVFSFQRGEQLPAVVKGESFILWTDGYSAPTPVTCEVTELKITGNVVDRLTFRMGGRTHTLANPERDRKHNLKYTLEVQ